MLRQGWFAVVLMVAGCSSGSSGFQISTADLSATDDAGACVPDPTFPSDCGKPCDRGNSLGVGMFCMHLEDCTDNKKATFCTKLFDAKNYFCTFRCDAAGPAGQCGEGASCQCQDGSCGCYPDSCFVAPTDGGGPASG
jgi:hypothetical protein